MNFPDTLEITVTEEDIKNGKVMECANCPVALAFKRIYPTLRPSTSIGSTTLFTSEITSEIGLVAEYGHDDAAIIFIGMFDIKRPVQPFTFTATKSR